MDRRTFIQLSAVGAVAVTVPQIHCRANPDNVLQFPGTLSSICDEKTICELGQAYIQNHPSENKSSRLQDLLLSNTDGKEMSSSTDTEALAVFLDKKIVADFKNANTVILKGWVLSLTEARQCALYSLTSA